MRRRGRLLWSFLPLFAWAVVAGAQVPLFDPLDWSLLQPGPTWAVTGDLLDDGPTGWQAVRLGFTTALPRGEGHWLWLRWRYVSFSTGGSPVARRWPAAVDTNAIAAGWPGEATVTGWDRPEVGTAGRSRLPLLGTGRFALRGMLPFADNRLYPLAARGTSLALAWRKDWSFAGGRTGAAMTGERILNFGAAGDDLTDTAFPALTRLAGEVTLLPGHGVRLVLQGDVVHHRGSRLGMVADWELGDTWHLVAGWRHDLSDGTDRTFRDALLLRLMTVGATPVLPAPEPEASPGRAGQGVQR